MTKTYRRLWATLILTTVAVIIYPGAVAAQDVKELQQQIIALQTHLNAMQATLDQIAAQQSRPNEPAQPIVEARPSGDPVKIKWEPAPSISSPDGQFEMNIRGRIFADSAWISDGDGNIDVRATELRAARFGIEGKAWQDVKYKFEADFTGNEVEIKDAYVQWTKFATFTLGQFKTPTSLEEITSGRHTTFMERASFTDAFGLARRIGFGVGFGGDDWTLNFGVFRGSNGLQVDNDEGSEIAGRATYSPKIGDVQLHLGGSFRKRNAGDQSNFQYRQRPHQHLSPERFVNTGRIGDQDMFYGIELAALWHSFHVAGEWSWLKAEDSIPTLRDPVFAGGYFELGWFITGENKGYKPNVGAFDRPAVKRPVFGGGPGAWQLALRYDSIDLTESGYLGGKQTTLIAGVNWYLNRHTRLMFNYNHTKVIRAFDVLLNGPDGKNEIDGFGIRAQVDW